MAGTEVSQWRYHSVTGAQRAHFSCAQVQRLKPWLVHTRSVDPHDIRTAAKWHRKTPTAMTASWCAGRWGERVLSPCAVLHHATALHAGYADGKGHRCGSGGRLCDRPLHLGLPHCAVSESERSVAASLRAWPRSIQLTSRCAWMRDAGFGCCTGCTAKDWQEVKPADIAVVNGTCVLLAGSSADAALRGKCPTDTYV